MKAEEHASLFQRWLRDHIGLMLKVVRAFAATPHDQEDLFQEVLVSLWSSIPKFRGDAKETTWIYRVSFNAALVWNRNEKRRQKQHSEFLKFAVPTVASSDSEHRNGQEMIDRLYEAIRQLPKVEASLAIMLLDGLSYQEMSDVLGISENYIGVKLNRIRKQLTELLKESTNEL